MAGRKPSVRRKNGYWYSNAGGLGLYFGRCSDVSRAEAMALLWRALAESQSGEHRAESVGRDKRGREREREHKALAFGEGPEFSSQSVGVGKSGMGRKLTPKPEPGPEFSSHAKALGNREGKETNSSQEPEPGPEELVSFPSPISHAKALGRKRPEAKGRASHLSSPLLSSQEPEPGPTLTVNALAECFLAWVEANRGAKAHAERSRHLRRFREAFGDVPAVAIGEGHIEAFTASLKAKGHALDYVHKHLVSVGAMFRKGVRKGWIPSVNPFASVEPLRLPPKALSEHDLPTPEEVQTLIAHAIGDMRDMLIVYHATGMRTHELLQARVGDYQRSTHQLVMANHKRSHTMRESKPRAVTLNAEAEAVIIRYCEGKPSSMPIFPRPCGEAKTSANVGLRFQALRKRAGVRESITIYSLRHLWISEAMMTGIDAMLIARMAGTSVKMIETVYGHFRTQSLCDAQSRLDAVRAKGQ